MHCAKAVNLQLNEDLFQNEKAPAGDAMAGAEES